MRKETLIISMVMLLLFYGVVSVKAAGSYEITQTQEKTLPELKEACEEFINQTAGFPMAGPIEILYDQAYPITFTEGFLTTKYKEEGSFLALAGEKHQWRIPVFFEDGKGGEIRLTQTENGKWAVAGWQKNGEKVPQIAASMNAICAVIDENPQLAQAETVRILADALYNAVFVVAVLGGQEYVVPFSIKLEEAKIETGIVYTAAAFVDLLEQYFDEKGGYVAPTVFGGLSETDSTLTVPVETVQTLKPNYWIISVTAAGLFLLLGIVYFVIYKVKK